MGNIVWVGCKSSTGLTFWILIMCIMFSMMVYYAFLSENWAKENPNGNDLSVFHYKAISCMFINLVVFTIGFTFLFFNIINTKAVLLMLMGIGIFITILLIGGILINLKIYS